MFDDMVKHGKWNNLWDQRDIYVDHHSMVVGGVLCLSKNVFVGQDSVLKQSEVKYREICLFIIIVYCLLLI